MLVERIEAVFDRCKSGIDSLTGYALLKRKFRRELGYQLDLENPKTWNEKIQWRKLNVYNPDFVRASDKLEMPELVREMIGAQHCEGIFTEIYYKTDDPDTLNFDTLPSDLMLKPTHGSGWLTAVRANEPRNDDELRKKCNSWLARRYGYRNHEWPYLHIKPRIMAEELLLTNKGHLANDVKLHVMNGKIAYVYYVKDRLNTFKQLYLNKDWAPICDLAPHPDEKPVLGWEKMKDVAFRIGQHFDYVRVDFLSTETRFALNELTFFPASGYNVSEGLFDIGIPLGKLWTQTLDGRR